MRKDMAELHFGTSINDLDRHLRSQGYGKASTFAVILLQIGMTFPKHVVVDHVREAAARKSYKYGKFGILAFDLLIAIVLTVLQWHH